MSLAPDNPMNRAMLSTLVCEAIVFGLAFPGMVIVSEISVLAAALGTGLAVLLCLLACARLRRPEGYPLAWAAQAAGVLLGFLTPMMFLVGAMFLAIWVVSFVLGRRIEADRARHA
ncbi:DUF4233 domain-containing protein [Luteococcus peritonei]|uniref:DUF4233 domain-containing protein n=1 Tax=Luteococcus peritonei TaxID=88874 RepID=A0ABW4RU97_9ACTN